jgi:hypothetical protein
VFAFSTHGGEKMTPIDADKQGDESGTEGPDSGRKPEDAGQDNRGTNDVDGNHGQKQDQQSGNRSQGQKTVSGKNQNGPR